MPGRPTLPSVLDYEDYRQFLRDDYAARKRADPRYSQTLFARRAGLASRSHFSLVAGGRQDLGPGTAAKFAQGLRLPPEEARYFALLVQANQARGPGQRAQAEADLARFQWDRTHRLTAPAERRDLLKAWARVLTLAMSRMKGFRAEPRWIARRLAVPVPVAEIRDALSYLTRNGLVSIRDRKVRRTAAGTFQVRARAGSPADWLDIERLQARLRRAAADPRIRQPGFGGTDSHLTVLTRAEANELNARYSRWIQEALPRRKGRAAEGELCLVLSDILPLTRPPS